MTLAAPDQASAGDGERGSARPTPRAVLLFAGAMAVSIIVIAANPRAWPLAVSAALLAIVLIAADLLRAMRRRQIRVTTTAPTRLAVATPGHVDVRLERAPPARRLRVALLLEQAGPAASPVIVEGQTSGGHVSCQLPLRGERRGRVELRALWMRWRGPLGLIERRWRLPLDHAVEIVPLVRGVQDAALTLNMEDARYGIKAMLRRGEGSEFETLREHVAGLDNRAIDWKRSARHNKLLSKVFRTERNHQIVLAFDTGHLMLEPIDGKTRLDHAIEAGLLLGWVSLKTGDLVGSFSFDATLGHFLAPAAGIASLARIQQEATRLAYSTEETNFTLGLADLNQRLKRRALVVLFTEFVDTVTAELLLDSIQRMANRHVVLFVTMRDPAMVELLEAPPEDVLGAARSVIANDMIRERAIVFERLTRMGIHVVDVPAGQVATRVVNACFEIKKRNLL